MTDAVQDALASALAGEYDILGPLGIGSGDAPVYLAREMATDSLVALRLPPRDATGEAQEYGLEVVRQLDGTVPEVETRCSHCGTALRHWSRFCPRCGRDISGMAPSVSGRTRDELRVLALNAAAGRYDVLGEMPRAEGGGLVYFARERATGRIVGLQLEAGPEATVRMTAAAFAALEPTLLINPAESGTKSTRRISIETDDDKGKGRKKPWWRFWSS